MSDFDWKAAEVVAKELGVHTRELVARGDPQVVIDWALQMQRENSGPRAASYGELAVLVGHIAPEPAPPPETNDDKEEEEEEEEEEVVDDAA